MKQLIKTLLCSKKARANGMILTSLLSASAANSFGPWAN